MNPHPVPLPDSVTFFFPYREVSGVPQLFGRMARHLAQHRAIRTTVVDYSDGATARLVKDVDGVTVTEFENGRKCRIDSGTQLVMQSNLPYNMNPELTVDPSTGIVFWTLYHLNLVPRFAPFNWAKDLQVRHASASRAILKTLLANLRGELVETVLAMHERGSLLFMDRSTLDATCSHLDVALSRPRFVPVACDDVPESLCRVSRATRGDKWSVAWVGRLADFKIFILLYLIERLSRHARRTRTPIEMHIVGDGIERRRLRLPQHEHEFFKVHWKGVLVGQDLDQFLVDEVDLLAAMGTSALEGAKWGIPTVLLDASYGPITGPYKFSWLYTAQEYCLANLLLPEDQREDGDSLADVFRELQSPERYEGVSRATFEYCRRNHGISSVASLFLEAVREARFTYGEFLPGILKKSLVRKAFEMVRPAGPGGRS